MIWELSCGEDLIRMDGIARATRQDRHGWESWCKIDTVMSYGDRSMDVGSRGIGRHSCESKVEAGLGQVVCSNKN
ncbi:hypothetical protein DVH24_004493 [Malus domestica]|uniref:Uncharacterized protein n=1 Tax=Malus domestica TaxID=3750 RepID=A0A498IC76_MALDO|nr:hypothetical protein DVH24_004493 [Malus domestica]